MTTLDDYLTDVIQRGDQGSHFLGNRCAPTLRNCPYVKIIKGPIQNVGVLDLPETYDVVVHSATGDPKITDVHEHARSVVTRLCLQAQQLGVTPIAFANVIDSRTGDLKMLEAAVTGLVKEANSRGLAIMNGENEILGDRVVPEANIMGTMISIVPKENTQIQRDAPLLRHDIVLARFSHNGQYVYINADGVGTKTDLHEKAGNPQFSVDDFAAMNLDDTSKLRATAKALSGVLEFTGAIPMSEMMSRARRLGQQLGISILIQQEEATGRIHGDSYFTHSLSGAVVSTIDKTLAQTPLQAQASDYLIAITGRTNPRSNGITDKRRAMVQLFGPEYQHTPMGRLFLEYLAQPSTILYSTFKLLIDQGLASNVYHMSGGAYNGKLAKPLAANNLFVRLENLFPPDWREITLAGANFTSAEQAFAKWPWGNDGFVTTAQPKAAIAKIEAMCLQGRIVGQVQQAVDGKTGVEIEPRPRKVVYFSGKE